MTVCVRAQSAKANPEMIKELDSAEWDEGKIKIAMHGRFVKANKEAKAAAALAAATAAPAAAPAVEEGRNFLPSRLLPEPVRVYFNACMGN